MGKIPKSPIGMIFVVTSWLAYAEPLSPLTGAPADCTLPHTRGDNEA